MVIGQSPYSDQAKASPVSEPNPPPPPPPPPPLLESPTNHPSAGNDEKAEHLQVAGQIALKQTPSSPRGGEASTGQIAPSQSFAQPRAILMKPNWLEEGMERNRKREPGRDLRSDPPPTTKG